MRRTGGLAVLAITMAIMFSAGSPAVAAAPASMATRTTVQGPRSVGLTASGDEGGGADNDDPGGVHVSIATPPILYGTTAIVGTNWSGYVAATDINRPKTGSVSEVIGTWIVPQVSATASATYCSDWVGIDGWTSATVEQLGTQAYSMAGQTAYSAWCEMYPAYPTYITTMTVSPGDVMTGEVSWITADAFQMNLTDVTKGVCFSAVQSLGQTADRVSAEWVHEAPSSTAGVLPLAQIIDPPVVFSGCKATIDGKHGPISDSHWQNASMLMVNSQNTNLVLAKPSPLSATGTEMSVAPPGPWATTLTIASNPINTKMGSRFVLAGLLRPGANSPTDLVTVQVMKPGSSRWSYSSVRQVYGQTVNGSGPWQYRYAPSLRGTYRFRASFAGKDGQTTATSRILSVSVH
jgi:hypothetical protein